MSERTNERNRLPGSYGWLEVLGRTKDWHGLSAFLIILDLGREAQFTRASRHVLWPGGKRSSQPGGLQQEA